MAARLLGDKANMLVAYLNHLNELDMEDSATLYRAVREANWEAVLDVADRLRTRNSTAWAIGILLVAGELQAADERMMDDKQHKRLTAGKENR